MGKMPAAVWISSLPVSYTHLLVTAPGGVLPMSIMAEEMGADVVKVSIFQVVRIIALVLLAPVVGNFLLS